VFTQCPECATVFRVTAPVLRAAQGQVRCGVCDANFDALRFLTDSVDTPPLKAPEAPAPPTAAPRTAATRSTPSEDEGRALAEIAATVARAARRAPARPATAAAPTPPPASDDDVNVLEPSDIEDIILGEDDGAGGTGPAGAEASLEFNVPPGEWDRVFVRERPPHQSTEIDIDLASLASPEPAAAGGAHPFVIIDEPAPAAGPTADDLSLVDEEALSRTDEYGSLEAELGGHAAATGGIEETWFDPARPAVPPSAAAAEARAASEDFASELAALPLEAPTRARTWRLAYASGAIALAVLLLVQLVHANREALAGIPGLGAAVAALYARLGAPIEPRWDLGAYEVKQWGAATGTTPGALHLRASLVNRASRAQPYPLLRVTLEDRFGARLARGEFTPAEYLPGRSLPGGLLAAGARADADLLLADPGSQAVGFELDVCLMRGAVLSCGGQLKPRGTG
jgi:predicted Zn finger-like uncharacterized protein